MVGVERHGQLHRGVEVGWVGFEWQARTQACSMVEMVMSTAGVEGGGQLHRGVEVGWGAFKRLIGVHCTAKSRHCRVEAGIERDRHFSGALKWVGGRLSAIWCSLSAQVRIEGRQSASGHFNGALKWGP